MPSAPPDPSTAAPDRGRIRLAAAALVLVAVVAYANSFGGPFIFDDKPAILENPTIRQLWPLSSVLTPPPIGSSVTGRPLANLSLALNHAVSGEAVWSYHAVNLLLHVLSGLALFGIARRTLARPVVPPALRAAALPLGLIVALVWLVHPLLTECVTSVIQRTESLVGLCYLATLYAFVRSLDSSRPGRWQIVSVAVCLLGMSAKEVMVTAPLLVLLYDRTFAAGSLAAALRQRGGYYAALAATWLLLAALVATAGGTRGVAAGFGLGVTPWTYALTQCRAIVLYLGLAFWPSPLVLDYGTDVVHGVSAVLPQALLLLALLALTLWAWVRRPMAGFLGVAFFLLLAPSSSVVPLVSQTIAEHRMYLPLAALVALILAGAYRWAGRGALAAALVVAAGFTVLTLRRNTDYRSEEAIWTDTVAHAPGNPRAQVNLAECLLKLDRPAEALAPAQEAVRLRPDFPEARANLGIALARLGRPEEALPQCLEALRLQPNGAREHRNLGGVLLQLGRWPEAVEHFETALRLAPDAPDALVMRHNLGRALLQAGRLPAAIEQFQAVLRIAPDRVETHYSLAVALGLSNRLPEAAKELEAVLRLQPDHAEARAALDSVRAELGR